MAVSLSALLANSALTPETLFSISDIHCGLVVRVPDYRSRGPGSIPGSTRFFREVVGLERGPLSLVSTTDELSGRNISGSGLESREYGPWGFIALTMCDSLSSEACINFADKRQTQASEFI
jgi:hypothetical protein